LGNNVTKPQGDFFDSHCRNSVDRSSQSEAFYLFNDHLKLVNFLRLLGQNGERKTGSMEIQSAQYLLSFSLSDVLNSFLSN